MWLDLFPLLMGVVIFMVIELVENFANKIPTTIDILMPSHQQYSKFIYISCKPLALIKNELYILHICIQIAAEPKVIIW
jgi:hypothetical protein